ncbi:MAG: LPS translocon maturation chaperone LptM [Lysobacter sp.]
MNARNPLLLAALVVSLPLAIAGCGNKGPLVMPDEVESVDALEMPTDTVPVELDEPALADPTESAPTESAPTVADPVPFDPIPIDPATVPDSPPETGTADDGNG